MADLAERPLRLVVVCGPTATGKTALGVALAKRLGGEVVCADSMQIYRGLSVGTAKVTPAQAQGIPHHMVDICEPQQPFSVAEYTARAAGVIADIAARGRLPIVVGGTGLYISSLLAGVRFAPHGAAAPLREQLAQQASREGAQAMWQRLQAVDAAAAAAIHPHNVKRVLRALEVWQLSGRTITSQAAQSLPAAPPYDAFVIGLRWADRQQLYRRIERRVDEMLAQGLKAEARCVWENRAAFTTAAQAIGYKELFPFFEGTAPLEECVQALKSASRRYAKRQLTWFGRMPQVHWLQPDELEDVPGAALALLAQAGFAPQKDEEGRHEEG